MVCSTQCYRSFRFSPSCRSHTRERESLRMVDVRSQFPSLERAKSFIFFDNAAGAQVPACVLEAVIDHLLSRNGQRGGPYQQSQEVDAMIARTRASLAAFLNARGA